MRSIESARPTAGDSSELEPGDPRGVALIAKVKLQGSSYSGVRRVSCQYHEGVLTLRGRVPSYYMKQLAQTMVRMIEGVDAVVSKIEVVDPATFTGISKEQ